MKQGKTLPEFVAELDRQQTAKRDFIADSTQLQMLTVEQSNAGSRTGVRLEVPINGHSETFNVADNPHNQLSARLGIPKRYYDVMLAREPGLLANNVNTWLHRKPERRMVRTLDGTARAFLSDRYRRLDNYDLAQAVLPVLTGANTEVRIESTQITDTRMYIKALFPRIEGEINRKIEMRTFYSITI